MLVARILIAIAVTLLLNPGVVTGEKKGRGSGSKKTAGKDERAVPKVLRVVGTPYDEEETTVSLKWRGRAKQISLYKDPAGVVAGKVSWKKGAKIAVEQSVVLIFEPAQFVAKQNTTVTGAEDYPVTKESNKELQQLSVKSGQTVSVYHYVGEGTCIISFRNKFYNAACPDPEQYKGPRQMKAKRKEWWIRVQVGKQQGWVMVTMKLFRVRVVGP